MIERELLLLAAALVLLFALPLALLAWMAAQYAQMRQLASRMEGLEVSVRRLRERGPANPPHDEGTEGAVEGAADGVADIGAPAATNAGSGAHASAPVPIDESADQDAADSDAAASDGEMVEVIAANVQEIDHAASGADESDVDRTSGEAATEAPAHTVAGGPTGGAASEKAPSGDGSEW